MPHNARASRLERLPVPAPDVPVGALVLLGAEAAAVIALAAGIVTLAAAASVTGPVATPSTAAFGDLRGLSEVSCWSAPTPASHTLTALGQALLSQVERQPGATD